MLKVATRLSTEQQEIWFTEAVTTKEVEANLMMTAEEKIAKLHEKMAARQHRKERRRAIVTGVTTAVLFVCFAVLLTGLLANTFGASSGVLGWFAGLYDHAVGYVLAGVVAFALGVVIGVSAKRRGQVSRENDTESSENSGSFLKIPDDSIAMAVGGSGNHDRTDDGQNESDPEGRDTRE